MWTIYAVHPSKSRFRHMSISWKLCLGFNACSPRMNLLLEIGSQLFLIYREYFRYCGCFGKEVDDESCFFYAVDRVND